MYGNGVEIYGSNVKFLVFNFQVPIVDKVVTTFRRTHRIPRSLTHNAR